MNRERFLEEVKKIALCELGVELSKGAPLQECGLDSLSLVGLLASLEDAFVISFGEEDLMPDQLKTADDIVELLEKSI